jgi:hypothetical protein
MFRAMVWKELREVRGIVLLGLAAYALLVLQCVNPRIPTPFMFIQRGGYGEGVVPFVQGNFTTYFGFMAAVIAVALGLRQVLGESVGGTYLSLLHRPANRRWLIGTKLFVGTVAYLFCGALPILAYGLWAATPGTHASPFEWSMTDAAWTIWWLMLALYLGAFLSGIRPGRWFGTRLFPLLGTVFAALVALGISSDTGWMFLPCAIALLVDVWLIVVILHAAQVRDFP